MRTRLAFALMAVATIGGLAVGWYEHSRAERLAAAAQKGPPPPADCSHANFASLTRAVSSFAESRRAAKIVPATAGDGSGDDDPAESFDDLSSDAQAELFELGDTLAETSKQNLTELIAKLRLTSEQEKQLRDRVTAMNERVARSLDRLVELGTQEEPVRPRDAIDALADGLNAVREADDGFRAALDDTQRATLATENFDMTSEIDPSMLLTRVITFAASAQSSSDDESED